MSSSTKTLRSNVTNKVQKNKKPAAKMSTLSQRLMGPPSQIWKSRLGWRIALAVFMTILTVQVVIMSITIKNYEEARLAEIVEIARSALIPAIEPEISDPYRSPIPDGVATRLTATTKITGLAIYSPYLNLIRTYGKPLSIVLLNQSDLQKSYRSANGNSFEMVFRQDTLRRPYIMVVQMDSSSIQPQLLEYVKQTLFVMCLMSAFVTTVLMLALGRWLLEPILFLRSSLLRASENPESPKIEKSPFDPRDEIGVTIELSQKLIRQNAENIRRIKSAAEDQIHKLAYYDTLTSLPNRTLFLLTLNEQTRQRENDANTGRFAVITMDLDHFKDINDTMGHNIGDAILRAVGKRLRAAMPESATVARSGEDEFAITMKLDDEVQTSRDIAERVIGVIRSEPFKVFNEMFQVRASIGVATYPDDGIDPDQVLKNADIALNRAKEEGRDLIKEYSEDFDRAVQQRFQMLRDLREAMERGQLDLYYQPQLDLNTGKVIGAEALLRWFKPDNSKEGGTFISPADFVPVAEQSGLIVPIGEWVIQTACTNAARWAREGHNFRIAVNVSGAQFYQSDIVAYVSKILDETKLPPHLLELEVTESVFMEDIQHTITILQNLHALGVELAIDDFGTGYSSLSYLRQFPIDRLKIDQSFIRNALNNADDAAIARTIVALGHSLNLKVIAEGVETKEHEQFLMDQGCDEVQGFRYSRPVPTEKFEAFVNSYNGDIATFSKA
jgi:diguanylate cyclase (GGDEF)-like protein